MIPFHEIILMLILLIIFQEIKGHKGFKTFWMDFGFILFYEKISCLWTCSRRSDGIIRPFTLRWCDHITILFAILIIMLEYDEYSFVIHD